MERWFNLTGGGYPNSATATATSSIDTDIVQTILKPQEIAKHDAITSEFNFGLKVFSLIVSADTWIVLNDGTEIPVEATKGYSDEYQDIYSLKFKTEVDYKISYKY